MNETGIYHLCWITLVITNFVVQLWYFFNDRNRPLFLAKKITTPLLLFGGLAVVIVSTRGFPIIPGILLLTMGLGELGIEGSTVVESKPPRSLINLSSAQKLKKSYSTKTHPHPSVLSVVVLTNT